MTENIWLALILGIVVIIVLWMFRGSLSRFFVRISREGVESELQTREANKPEANGAVLPSSPPTVNISGNKQVGKDNKIVVARDNVNVSDNVQAGEKQSIEAKPDSKKKKK